MLLPSLTRQRARLLPGLRIGELYEPCPINIKWLSCFISGDRPALISKRSHHHNFFETHFILSGNVTYRLNDGTEYTLYEGDGFIISPDIPHTVINAACSRLTLAFTPSTDSELYRELARSEVSRFTVTETLISRFECILSEAENGGFLSKAIIRARVFDIICDVARLIEINEYRDIPIDVTTGGEAGIERAFAYINDNRDRMLTCLEVSRQCHFNEKYLSRLFKIHTGMTLLEYIHKQKMIYAEELLRDKTLSLKAVSEKLGFANEYYFNSFFKRIYGITPGNYRKLI